MEQKKQKKWKDQIAQLGQNKLIRQIGHKQQMDRQNRINRTDEGGRTKKLVGRKVQKQQIGQERWIKEKELKEQIEQKGPRRQREHNGQNKQ